MQRLRRPHRQRIQIPPASFRSCRPNRIGNIYGVTIILLLPLIAIALALALVDAEFARAYNSAAPVYLIVVIALAAYRIAYSMPSALWSPAFWLLISSAVFFGFGPLVEIYGNDETQLRLSASRIAISQIELFNSNLLSLISIVGLLFGFWLHTQLRSEVWRRAVTQWGTHQKVIFKPETVTIVFIVGGMLLTHAITRPSQWGQFDLVVPGALTSLAPVVDLGFALAAYLAFSGSRKMWLALLLIWPLHLFLTALSFSKAGLVTALLLPAIGAFMHHRQIMRLAISGVVIAAVFSYSQDFVHYGRAEILRDTGTIWQAGYAERIPIATAYFVSQKSENPISDLANEEQGWWIRLNYSGAQAIGMRFRDDGVFIDSLSNVWTMFVPRIIWPNKPIYIAPGMQFYELVTGNTGTYFGISVYGDIYWQFGWAGVLLITPIIGWMFAMMAWHSIEIVQQKDFARMPLVLLSMLTAASGLTKWLANGIIAVIPIYIAYLLAIYGIVWWMGVRKRSRAGNAAGIFRSPAIKTAPWHQT